MAPKAKKPSCPILDGLLRIRTKGDIPFEVAVSNIFSLISDPHFLFSSESLEIEKVIINILSIFIKEYKSDYYAKLCKQLYKLFERRFGKKKGGENSSLTNFEVSKDFKVNVLQVICSGLALMNSYIPELFKNLLECLNAKAWSKAEDEHKRALKFTCHVFAQIQLSENNKKLLSFFITQKHILLQFFGNELRELYHGAEFRMIFSELVDSGLFWFFDYSNKAVNADQLINRDQFISNNPDRDSLLVLSQFKDEALRKRWAGYVIRNALNNGNEMNTDTFIKLAENDEELILLIGSTLMKQQKLPAALKVLASQKDCDSEIDPDEEKISLRSKRLELVGHLQSHFKNYSAALIYFHKSLMLFCKKQVLLHPSFDSMVISGRCAKILNLLPFVDTSIVKTIGLDFGDELANRYLVPLIFEKLDQGDRNICNLVKSGVMGSKIKLAHDLLYIHSTMEIVNESNSQFDRLVENIDKIFKGLDQLEIRDVKTRDFVENLMLDYVKAIVNYKDTTADINLEGIPDVRDRLVHIYSLLKALQKREKSLPLLKRIPLQRQKLLLYELLGDAYMKRPLLKEARHYYELALSAAPDYWFLKGDKERISTKIGKEPLYDQTPTPSRDLYLRAILEENERLIGKLILQLSATENEENRPLLLLLLDYYCDLPFEAYDLKKPRTISSQLLERQLNTSLDLDHIFIVKIDNKLVILETGTMAKIIDFSAVVNDEFESIFTDNRSIVSKEATANAASSDDLRRGWWRQRKSLDTRMKQIECHLRKLLVSNNADKENESEDDEDLVFESSRLSISQLEEESNNGKILYLVTCKRTAKFPWEQCFRNRNMVRLNHLISRQSRPEPFVNDSMITFLLNPLGDLTETQKMFEPLLVPNPPFIGVTGRELQDHGEFNRLTSSNLFLYFGHNGPSSKYLSQNTNSITCKSVLMGCSSARPLEKNRFNSYASEFIKAGCSFVMGNLWDVTDKDIDRFTLALLRKMNVLKGQVCEDIRIWCKAMREARKECLLRHINGSAPILIVNNY